MAASTRLNDENSREKGQNVRGVVMPPRGMKMDLVVMSRPSHNLLWNRPHFLNR